MTTETVPEHISSRFAREETSSAPSGGESDSPPSSPPRIEGFSLSVVEEDEAAEWREPYAPIVSPAMYERLTAFDEGREPRGTVSWAPAGTDPILGEGWTELGYVTDDDPWLAHDPEPALPHGIKLWDNVKSATISFPKVSRETIMLAMGLDSAEQLRTREPWPPKPTLLEQLGIPVVESPYVPPGQVIIGAAAAPVRVWPRERDWWEDGMWAYRAAERIAMDVQRYDVTVTSSVPTIGRPPRKGRGLTGRRYRAARRAYARKRRAWVREGSPTYATAIRMPSMVITDVT